MSHFHNLAILSYMLFAIAILPVVLLTPLTLAQTSGHAAETSKSMADNKSTVTQPSSPPSTVAHGLEGLNPPFKFCESDFAIYIIQGTTTSGKLSNPTTGANNVTILINNNMTRPLLGKILVDNNQSVDLNIEHLITQCIHKVSAGLSKNISLVGRNIANPIFNNPPVKKCDNSIFESMIYLIKAVSNQTQLPLNITGKEHITMAILNDFVNADPRKTTELPGELIVGNKNSIDLNIQEIDTLCINKAF